MNLKNKDLYDNREEAISTYYDLLFSNKTVITFDAWLFEDVVIDVADKESDGPCENCRFYFAPVGIQSINKNGRCLLKFKTPKGSCKEWQPTGKQKPSCYSCRFSLTGGKHNCLCMKGYTRQEDDDSCEEWKESK